MLRLWVTLLILTYGLKQSYVRAGKSAGARVIAFRTTVAEADLQRAGADFILNNCSDVVVAHDSAGLTLILNDTRGDNSPR